MTVHIDYRSRPNVVSVLIGYRFLEKFMFFSDFTCTVRIAKIFAKISYHVTKAFVSFFWNLAILFSNSSLGNEKLSRTDIR